MLTLPEVFVRKEQLYAYVTFTVAMSEMQRPATEGYPAIFSLLAQEGITPAGAPFYNYRRINMSTTLEVEAGVPVTSAGTEENGIKFSTLPSGRYVGLTWHGHPDKLESVTAVLIGWTRQMELALDMEERPDGDHFACRLEIYENDPEEQPDMDKWVTHLAFKLQEP